MKITCIKHKFIIPQTQTVTDEALKTATRISITVYHIAGARFTREIRCDASKEYNYIISEVQNTKYTDIWDYNRQTGTLKRVANSGLIFEMVSVDYI